MTRTRKQRLKEVRIRRVTVPSVLMRGNRCVLVAVAPVAGCLSSDVFTNTRVVGKDRLGLCVATSANHFNVVVYVSNDNSNWITWSTYYAESNGVHQALAITFKCYKITINNDDPTPSVVINVADLSHK